MKVVVICNAVSHVRDILKLDPNNPDLVIITPERTEKMHGLKDIYYYEMRPMYAREQSYAVQHGWMSVNRTELRELLAK